MSPIQNQTLALAGLFQSAVLIDRIAFTGKNSSTSFTCCFDSLFRFETSTTLEIFGELTALNLGLESLVDYLSGKPEIRVKHRVYYVLSMLKIGSSLRVDKKRAERMQSGLRSIQLHADQFCLGRESVNGKIDILYQQLISNMNPRIMVRGNPAFLEDSANASKVRTLLLAGIRAGVLWQQLGGSRWKLVLQRKHFLAVARKLLEKI